MDQVAIRQWLVSLDHMSYYDLFRANPKATYDELHAAFRDFAETFHPDVHRGRHPNEQEAIGRIYRRGMEAWRVLSDDGLRVRYDEALANGILRPENLVVDLDRPGRSASMSPGTAPPGATPSTFPQRRASDQVRFPGARPFVIRAEELTKKGDPKQAKIQLVMALHMDKGNPALEAFANELDAAILAKAEEEKKQWKR